MNIWHSINPARISDTRFVSVVEIPRGSKLKYELDKETGLLVLSRVLHTSTHYPANYGFIPRTLAEDGDPLDVLILSDETFNPLSLIPSLPIGIIRLIDDDELDEKVIAVAENDPTYNGYKSIHDLPAHIADEMSHFFSVYKQLEGKQARVQSVGGPQEAADAVRASMARYKKRFVE